VSQHLRVLKEAGLVRDRKEGTRRLYSIDAEGLRALREYLERYWDVALASFKEHVEEGGEDER
jgi:DNA-binding transcriptional ArsR family regulator